MCHLISLYISTSLFLDIYSKDVAQKQTCVQSLSHYERVQQQTPPGYVLVFQTCLSAGMEFHLCCSSHQQCPDGPNEEL